MTTAMQMSTSYIYCLDILIDSWEEQALYSRILLILRQLAKIARLIPKIKSPISDNDQSFGIPDTMLLLRI